MCGDESLCRYGSHARISRNYALREALRLVSEEGLEARWKRHADNAKLFAARLKDIGLECFIPEATRLSTLISVTVPNGIDAKAACKYCLDTFNVEIGGGLGELAGKIFRVGTTSTWNRFRDPCALIVLLQVSWGSTVGVRTLSCAVLLSRLL